jgi:hypothetical protein
MEKIIAPVEQENNELSHAEQLNAISETMSNEQDDWFLDQIIQGQPNFWWVY